MLSEDMGQKAPRGRERTTCIYPLAKNFFSQCWHLEIHQNILAQEQIPVPVCGNVRAANTRALWACPSLPLGHFAKEKEGGLWLFVHVLGVKHSPA